MSMNMHSGEANVLVAALLKGERYKFTHGAIGAEYTTESGVRVRVTMIPMGPVMGTRVEVL